MDYMDVFLLFCFSIQIFMIIHMGLGVRIAGLLWLWTVDRLRLHSVRAFARNIKMKPKLTSLKRNIIFHPFSRVIRSSLGAIAAALGYLFNCTITL